MGWGIKNLKTPGPHGVGNLKFENPGAPWGGGFEYPWGTPNTKGAFFEIFKPLKWGQKCAYGNCPAHLTKFYIGSVLGGKRTCLKLKR